MRESWKRHRVTVGLPGERRFSTLSHRKIHARTESLSFEDGLTGIVIFFMNKTDTIS